MSTYNNEMHSHKDTKAQSFNFLVPVFFKIVFLVS